MRLASLLGPLLLAAALGGLAGCDSPAEKAEAHYQRALAYLAEGDTERATVEFRNVFRLNGEHAAARLRYAELLRDRGDTREAMAQYLRLVEQAPNLAAGHRDLADLALETQDFETASIHTARAYALDPADPRTRALKATIDFRKRNDRPAAVAMAEGVLAETPDDVLAHLVLVADRLAAKDLPGALVLVDAGLAAVPDDQSLHLARLALIEEQGDAAAVGAELATLNRLYPDDTDYRDALVRWHLASGQPDAAEAVLRAAADAASTAASTAAGTASTASTAGTTASTGPALTLARFLLEVRGPDAARAELAARAAAAEAAGGDPRPYARAIAGLDFEQGDSAAAIAAMRGMLDGATPSDETRSLEVGLAEMLEATGDRAGAAALAETVLAADPTQIGALKLRARMAIEDDRPDAAIQDMRAALTVAPRDPEVMTIMAYAHERAGDRGLMGERLALAVEASNRAPAESLRYAGYLMQEGRPGPAEGVVVDALRRTPEDRDLLAMLGRIHLARRDWARAGQVAGILGDIGAAGDPVATAMAASLETARLAGEGRPEAAIPLLETLAAGSGQDDGSDGSDGGGEAAAMADLVRARVAAGDLAGAETYLAGVLAADPGSVPGRTLQGGLRELAGDPAGAEALYRAVIADDPAAPQPYLALFGLLAGQGRVADASAALDEGIAATEAAGQDFRLRFTRAGLREAEGDGAGAIADYERLYARDSGEPVVANNLASLLTAGMQPPAPTTTDGTTVTRAAITPAAAADPADAAALERAFAIARRLRDSPVPEFQDTYGWILLLRGEAAAARPDLAAAAAALPGNAQVQFHHAEAERLLGDATAARAGYAAALAAAEAGSPLPQATAARAWLDRLAPPAAGPGDAGGDAGGDAPPGDAPATEPSGG